MQITHSRGLASSRYRVRVCQNKHCSKANGGRALLTNLANLIPPSTLIEFEASGCLSECGEGPNVEVVSSDGRSFIYKGVNDADSARDLLKNACEFQVPSILAAAVAVMNRAEKTIRVEERENMVTSVIYALERDDCNVGKDSHALASAFVMRADARLALDEPNVEGALADSRRAAAIDPSNGRVWRVLAESEEASGHLDKAVAAVKKWGQVDPESATKAAKESDRLNNYSQP